MDIIPDCGEWEEVTEWVDDAHISEKDLLSWGDNLQIKGWCVLLEGQFNCCLETGRLKVNSLDGTEMKCRGCRDGRNLLDGVRNQHLVSVR